MVDRIKSRLSDRKQWLVINGKRSGWSGVSIGVHPGLGPGAYTFCNIYK